MSRENALLACLCILTMGVEAGAGASRGWSTGGAENDRAEGWLGLLTLMLNYSAVLSVDWDRASPTLSRP